ncbi:MAG: hypothetical protein FWE63_00420 [Bacteroidales bacterium]|nr:hypothetical protein [Bacteroidales bacterium]
MGDNLQYAKGEKISLKKHFSEKWLQDRIEEDPSILGLGELDLIQRERKQSSGGRIDFLFLNSEIETMYETEIQLGATDESHIIRTIEYWDIERRRYPSKEHRAVIVAEEVTNRFFNVIALMNRSIPIIAIQLNAIKIDNKILLNFTKVLDIYEAPEDEENLGGEEVGRAYWEKKSNPKSIAIMDEMIKIAQSRYPDARVTYNKHHVALGTSRRNFMWFHPRKTPNNCHFEIKLDKNLVTETKAIFDELGIPYTLRKESNLAVSIQNDDLLKKHADKIATIINQSIEAYS